jgi:hypothetical protein
MAAQSREDGRGCVEADFWMVDPRESREAAWEAIERGIVDQDSGGGVNSTTERCSSITERHRHSRHHR